MIKKKSIVWYWHRQHREWRKGKVISMNKYDSCGYGHWAGLYIIERNTKKPYFVPQSETAYPASDPKPHLPIEQYTKWHKLNTKSGWYMSNLDRKKYNLLRKLNITA